MNEGLPPFKNGEHNSKSTSTIDCVISPLRDFLLAPACPIAKSILLVGPLFKCRAPNPKYQAVWSLRTKPGCSESKPRRLLTRPSSPLSIGFNTSQVEFIDYNGILPKPEWVKHNSPSQLLEAADVAIVRSFGQ